METSKAIEVPWQKLNAELLEAVVDDFILREGTDYGWVEKTLEQKRLDVMAQLRTKRAHIWFDPEDETITLVARG